jgi:hypothetical protein
MPHDSAGLAIPKPLKGMTATVMAKRKQMRIKPCKMIKVHRTNAAIKACANASAALAITDYPNFSAMVEFHYFPQPPAAAFLASTIRLSILRYLAA